MNPIDCYIHHHLGLGDHIICNGLVRYVADKYQFKNIGLVVKRPNLNNVERMFSDRPEIKFFVVNEDREFVEHYAKNKKVPLLRVGFEKCKNQDFDKSFYDSVNVPFDERWNSWGLKRDLEQEAKVISELNIDGDYIFVHDASSVGSYELNINSDLQQINPRKLSCEKSIFDWLGIIEGAKEIHCIDSSFMHIIDSYRFDNKKYYHTIKTSVLRNGITFSLQNDWEFINYG
jgi:hypothetical protein